MRKVLAWSSDLCGCQLVRVSVCRVGDPGSNPGTCENLNLVLIKTDCFCLKILQLALRLYNYFETSELTGKGPLGKP